MGKAQRAHPVGLHSLERTLYMLHKSLFIFIATFFCCSMLFAEPSIELQYMKNAYPDTLHDVSETKMTWKNGDQLDIKDPPSFFEKLFSFFSTEKKSTSISINDLRCDHYEPFFKEMYGKKASEVESHLTTVYWMPKAFGKRYPLLVTTINGVDKKIKRISTALEKLPSSYRKYLANPGGAFYWRNVARESYLSSHSFGIAIDINSRYGSYWMWDLKHLKHPFSALTLRNNIPMKIVEIFEQEGFLWGGRWYFYDTMHFEYRPEMFEKENGQYARYNHVLGMRCASA